MTVNETRRPRTAFFCAVALAMAAMLVFAAAWGLRYVTVFGYVRAVERAGADAGPDAPALARLVADLAPDSAEARLHYADVLWDRGRRQEAAAQYERATQFRTRPNPEPPGLWPSFTPRDLPTWRWHCCPRARIRLAQLAADPEQAVAHIELARAYGGLDALLRETADPAPLRAFIARAYRDYGAWGRFDLEGLDSVSASAVKTLAAQQGWGPGPPAEASEAQQHFWAALRTDTADPAGQLRRAAACGHPDAPFFLGRLLQASDKEEAAAQFLATARDSLYRPFAAAAVLALGVGDKEALEAEVRDWFTRRMDAPAPYVRGEERPAIEGVALEPLDNTNAPFRALIRWRLDGGDAPEAPQLLEEDGERFVLSWGGRLLELRWLTNLVPFGDFRTVHLGAGPVPGWVEPELAATAAWRPGHCIEAAADGTRRLALGVDEDGGQARAVTIPMALDDFGETPDRYLFLTRCRSRGAKIYAGWSWLDENDRVIYAHNPVNQRVVPQWRWAAEYGARPTDAAYVQAQAGIFQSRGRAWFDAVIVARCGPPVQK